MAPTTTQAATGSGSEIEYPSLPDNTALGWSPWLWPAVAIVVVAVADTAGGTPGAVGGFGLLLIAACLAVFRSLRCADAIRISLLACALGGGAVLIALTASPHQVRTGPVDLRGKHPSSRTIRSLDLRGAQLAGVDLNGFDLRNIDLAGASAPGASLVMARLEDVNLRGADLRGANLTDACLHGADLTGALLNGATVSGADLRGISIEPQAAKTLIGRPALPWVASARCRE